MCWRPGSQPTSHLSSLLEMARTGTSGHAQEQPQPCCTLCSNTAPLPHLQRAFRQLPPAHPKTERGLEKRWCSDNWVLMVPLSITTALSVGSLPAAPPGKGEVCKGPSQAKVSFASLSGSIQHCSFIAIASEWCQQFNPNPVRLIILLFALLIFAPATLLSPQAAKGGGGGEKQTANTELAT